MRANNCILFTFDLQNIAKQQSLLEKQQYKFLLWLHRKTRSNSRTLSQEKEENTIMNPVLRDTKHLFTIMNANLCNIKMPDHSKL